MTKIKWKKIFTNRTEKVNRSKTGNAVMLLFVGIVALSSALPLILSFGMSLKPIHELYKFPPTLLPQTSTFDNYEMLFSLLSSTRVAFSRYIFNTFFITFVTVALHIVFASMAAYPLSQGNFPGKKVLNNAVLYSLMFVPAVADVVNYQTIVSLGWIDTYMATIAPYVSTTLGLFLLRNYMSTVPKALIEAARIDGCTDFSVWWKIVMPICKPAWLTVMIIMVQNMWGQTHSAYIYKESLKTLPYALSQITTGGYVRAGAAQAVGIIMLIVPALIFVFNQSKMIETMATSGIK